MGDSLTRAIQIDLLLAGLVHPTTGEAVGSGTVYFYAAGTTTAKNVWTEKEKTNAYTSYSLSAIGTAQLYAEGNYKVVVKDSDGATVQTLDNIRLEFPYYGIRTVIQTGSQLSQDDFLLVNTTSGAVTINALAAASWTRPLKIQRIAGSNGITLDPNGSETVDGSATLTWNSDAIVEIISDGSNLRTAGFRSSFADADNDTKIQVEESTDEDIIRFDTAGVQRVTIDANGLHGVLADADGDTKIQVEESADEDVIRFDIGGAEVAIIDADGLTADEVDTPDFRISGTQITATAAEINTACDGITATASEINTACDGITATATEINAACDGIGVTIPKQKIIDIGDWNMNTTDYVDIAHGLTQSKIRGVYGVIRNDANDSYYTIPYVSGTYGNAEIGILFTSTNIRIARYATGMFDSTSFESTSYNRGWIVVTYID